MTWNKEEVVEMGRNGQRRCGCRESSGLADDWLMGCDEGKKGIENDSKISCVSLHSIPLRNPSRVFSVHIFQ